MNSGKMDQKGLVGPLVIPRTSEGIPSAHRTTRLIVQGKGWNPRNGRLGMCGDPVLRLANTSSGAAEMYVTRGVIVVVEYLYPISRRILYHRESRSRSF